MTEWQCICISIPEDLTARFYREFIGAPYRAPEHCCPHWPIPEFPRTPVPVPVSKPMADERDYGRFIVWLVMMS